MSHPKRAKKDGGLLIRKFCLRSLSDRQSLEPCGALGYITIITASVFPTISHSPSDAYSCLLSCVAQYSCIPRISQNIKPTLNMDAAFAIASQTQSPVTGGLPKAQDMTRHLNRMAKHREASALKELYKYMTVPGMVSEQ